MSNPSDKLEAVNPKDIQGAKKAPINLIPPVALVHESLAFQNGAEKYGPFNWREKRVLASVYIGAALRHLLAYADGEDRAADSGLHHLAHVRACLAILLDAEECGQLGDDRPGKGTAGPMIEALATKDAPPKDPPPCRRCGGWFDEIHTCKAIRKD